MTSVSLSENPAHDYLKVEDMLGMEIPFIVSQMDKNSVDKGRLYAARCASKLDRARAIERMQTVRRQVLC
jgi:hypothetical protein